MPIHQKGDGKSSLNLMELHHKELDRPSLEPLSFGFTSGTPSYQSNPVWIQCKCIIKEPTNPGWIQWNRAIKEGDRSSLEPLSFGVTSGTPSYQSSLYSISLGYSFDSPSCYDRLWIHCQCAVKEPHTNPISFQCHCTIKRMTIPVWIQCQCSIKEIANPVWIQWNFTKKNLTDPVWNHSHLALLMMLQATNPVWI